MRKHREALPGADAIAHDGPHARQVPRRQPIHARALVRAKHAPRHGLSRGGVRGHLRGCAGRERRGRLRRRRGGHRPLRSADGATRLRLTRGRVERREPPALLLVHAGVRQHLPGHLAEPGSLALVRDERGETVPEPRRRRRRRSRVPVARLLPLGLGLHGVEGAVEREKLGLTDADADGVLFDDLGVHRGLLGRLGRLRGCALGFREQILRRLPRGDAPLLQPPLAGVRLTEDHRAPVADVPLHGEPAGSGAQRVEGGVALLHRALGARALLVAQRALQVHPRALDEGHVDERGFVLLIADDEHLGQALGARDVRVRPRGFPRHVPRRRRIQLGESTRRLGAERTHPKLPEPRLAHVEPVAASDAHPLALGDLAHAVARQVHLQVATVAEDDLILGVPMVGIGLTAHRARIQLGRLPPHLRNLRRLRIVLDVQRGPGRGSGRLDLLPLLARSEFTIRACG